MQLIDLTGQSFGRLEVIRYLGCNEKAKAMWECRCSCGVVRPVEGGGMRSGRTRSCGCLRMEMYKNQPKTIHGMYLTPEYKVWGDVKRRCTYEKHQRYRLYGAIGITICDEWKNSFMNFYKDLGPKPPGTMLKRKDLTKGFSADNCYWGAIPKKAESTK